MAWFTFSTLLGYVCISNLVPGPSLDAPNVAEAWKMSAPELAVSTVQLFERFLVMFVWIESSAEG